MITPQQVIAKKGIRGTNVKPVMITILELVKMNVVSVKMREEIFQLYF